MKKYLFLLIALVAMSSCEPKQAKIVERTEEEALIRFDIVRHFEYKGHQYISFQYAPNAYKSFMGIVHDPECLCGDLKDNK